MRSAQKLGVMESEYAMTFAQPQDFCEIAVSSTMVSDHFTGQYYKGLKSMVTQREDKGVAAI